MLGRRLLGTRAAVISGLSQLIRCYVVAKEGASAKPATKE
jgi:hypothetical protein